MLTQERSPGLEADPNDRYHWLVTRIIAWLSEFRRVCTFEDNFISRAGAQRKETGLHRKLHRSGLEYLVTEGKSIISALEEHELVLVKRPETIGLGDLEATLELVNDTKRALYDSPPTAKEMAAFDALFDDEKSTT